MTDAPSQQAALTRADAVALWHSVQAFRDMVRAMPTVDGITPEQMAAEQQRLAAAKAALRKVQAMVRAGRRAS